ncbi:DEAD/DEAH box helicase [Campylobacter californiensis]|uniref:DEAD/DEAH box helicase n=1 Tax=Campylobacter californiensis TaxID=1032243 RepID=UPI001473425F|nr:DEAD/DEAH box helicase [Campylobacter sp. RM12916]MBE3610258.1 DEAD/DEAH box helicase [Campylobacter sp. RM12916]
MSFSNLGLSTELLRAIKEAGYTAPTTIQTKAIPAVLAKKDVMASAQTGTGKTASFTLPILEHLQNSHKKGKKDIKALVLVPTRELALQVAASVETYGKFLYFKSAVIFGGVDTYTQKRILKKGVDIVIATPGRLLDLASQECVDLSKVEHFVLDEADRMLDMGFVHSIKKIISFLPKDRQSLMFSATFSAQIKSLADGLLNSPVLIEAEARNTTSHNVTQSVHHVDKQRKKELLLHMLNTNDWKQILVFTRTKHGANKLNESLVANNISSTAIHGNKSQSARLKALKDFKNGNAKVLVATDIFARGIDIQDLPYVVNYELPDVAEDYVHRIGRTGRAGNKGEAISLVCVDEHYYLSQIEKLINQKINVIETAGFEVDKSIKPEPIRARRVKTSGQNRGDEAKFKSRNNRTKTSKKRSSNDALSYTNSTSRDSKFRSNSSHTRTNKPRSSKFRSSAIN